MTMTTEPGNRSSSQIEREVESERARVTETLEQIRDRMSPGQVVDQFLGYAKESGGGDFARNLGRSVRDNPLPVLLIGAGIGWLMTSGRNGHDGHSPDHQYPVGTMPPRAVRGQAGGPRNSTGAGTSHGVSDKASEYGAKASGAASRTGEAASGMASSAYDSASRAGQKASDMASSAYDSARSTYESATRTAGSAAHRVGEAASSATGYASSRMHDARDGAHRVGEYAQRSWTHMAEEQPLVLGALGFALGAALGAGLPRTRSEDRIVGSASDHLKDQVRGAASEQYEHAKDVASETYRDVVDDLDKQGYSADSAKKAAGSVGETVRSAADKVAEDAKEEIKSARASASSSASGTGGDKSNQQKPASATSATGPAGASKPGGGSTGAPGTAGQSAQNSSVSGSASKPQGKDS